MRNKHLNIMLLPEGKRGLRFKISLKLAYFLGGFFILFFLLLVYLLASYGMVYQKALEADKLTLENKLLSENNARVSELQKQLIAYRDFVQKVGELAGIRNPRDKSSPLDQKDVFHAMNDENYSQIEGYDMSDLKVERFNYDPFIDNFIPEDYPVEGWITRGFVQELEGSYAEHPGVDIACKEGTEVKATACGWVRFSGWDPVYGNLVILEHKDGYLTLYAHNREILIKEKEFVNKGKVIALSGNTGRSSAPHLHYEIRKDGMPVDPQNFLAIGERDER